MKAGFEISSCRKVDLRPGFLLQCAPALLFPMQRSHRRRCRRSCSPSKILQHCVPSVFLPSRRLTGFAWTCHERFRKNNYEIHSSGVEGIENCVLPLLWALMIRRLLTDRKILVLRRRISEKEIMSNILGKQKFSLHTSWWLHSPSFKFRPWLDIFQAISWELIELVLQLLLFPEKFMWVKRMVS